MVVVVVGGGGGGCCCCWWWWFFFFFFFFFLLPSRCCSSTPTATTIAIATEANGSAAPLPDVSATMWQKVSWVFARHTREILYRKWQRHDKPGRRIICQSFGTISWTLSPSPPPVRTLAETCLQVSGLAPTSEEMERSMCDPDTCLLSTLGAMGLDCPLICPSNRVSCHSVPWTTMCKLYLGQTHYGHVTWLKLTPNHHLESGPSDRDKLWQDEAKWGLNILRCHGHPISCPYLICWATGSIFSFWQVLEF